MDGKSLDRTILQETLDSATMSVVIDPRVEESPPGFIRVFEDLRLVRDYLTYLRSN